MGVRCKYWSVANSLLFKQVDIENLVRDIAVNFRCAFLFCFRAFGNSYILRRNIVSVRWSTPTRPKESAQISSQGPAPTTDADKIIDNLLDNITPTNREYIDRRLNELKQQRQQLDSRLEELDRISLSQAEIAGIVNDAMEFISGLEFTLRQGPPQTKLTTLRQCNEKTWVNKPAGEIKLAIFRVPAGNLQAIQEFKASV